MPKKQVLTPAAPESPPTLSGSARGIGRSLPRRSGATRTSLPVRQIAVSAATAAVTGCVLVQLLSASGPLKAGPRTDSTVEVLDPSGSLLAPAAAFWWLWLPVAALWLGYALYQWLPGQQPDPRHHRLGWTIFAAELTAVAWLIAVSAGSAAAVLAVAAAQIAIGLTAVHHINRQPADSTPERTSTLEGLLTNVPLGWFLSLGVLSLTTALGFVLTREETDVGGWGGTAWTLAGLATVTVGITVVCMTDRGHLPVGLPVAAGLVCVAVERVISTPQSFPLAAAAAGAAFLITVSAGSRRHQVDLLQRRRARAADDTVPPPDDDVSV